MNLVRDYKRFLEDVAGRYRSEGYDVHIEPQGARVPPFLADYKPDLIARRGRDRVVIEIKRSDEARRKGKLRDIAARIKAEPGWRFDIVLYDPANYQRPKKASKRLMRASLDASMELFGKGEKVAAVLLAWSVLEAAGRLAMEKIEGEAEDTLAPADLLKSLVSHGELDEGDFTDLMRIYRERNRLAHGELRTSLSSDEFNKLGDLIRALLDSPRRDTHVA